jgi:radical SAM protein with 4Fe4S-binding SPASM domain
MLLEQVNISKPKNIFPFYIDFAVTYRCNAKCKHCSINADENVSKYQKYEMDTDAILKAIDQFSEMGVMLVGLTGGEALLREDIYEIIDYCHKKGILAAIATNGIELTQSTIDKLILHKIDSIFISLDHHEGKTHDLIRGVDDIFNKAVRSIKYCISKKVPVTVGITPMKTNYNEIGDTIDFIVSLGVTRVNISNFVPTGRGAKELDLSKEEWKGLYNKLKFYMNKYGNKVRFQIHDVKMNFLLNDEQDTSDKDYKGCLAGYTHCYILPNGDVQACVMLPIKIGNIMTDQMKMIIEDYQNSDNVINKNLLTGKCGQCKLKYRCGGCRANAYAYYNEPIAEDPHCWIQSQ